MKKIKSFTNQYRFLSNFYLKRVDFEGMTYPTNEHAFQAAKTFNIKARERISKLATPADAKKAGRALVLRENWDQIKYSVMKDIVRIKFSIPELKQALLDTGDQELIEGNWWGDYTWGVCNGVGTNWLGKMLVEVREEIKN